MSDFWTEKMRTKFLLSVAAILMFSQILTVRGQENIPPPMDVIFLVDVSGSMRYTDPDRIVLSAIADFIDKLPEASRVGVIGFSGRIQHVIPLTYTDNEVRAQLRDELSRFVYVGYTDIGLAFMYAIDMIEDVQSLNNPMIIFTSDGYIQIARRLAANRTARMSYDDVEAALDILDRLVPIYTVGMHNPDGIDVALLDMIAERSGGLSKFTYDAEELPEIFAEIFEHHTERVQYELPSIELMEEEEDETLADDEVYEEEVVDAGQLAGYENEDEAYEIERGTFEMGALHYLAIFFGLTALVGVLRFIRIVL